MAIAADQPGIQATFLLPLVYHPMNANLYMIKTSPIGLSILRDISRSIESYIGLIQISNNR